MSSEALVFSDLHFGDPRSALHRPEVLDKLLRALRPHAPIRRLVLLGDILDLQMSNWSWAVEGVPVGGAGRRLPGFRRFLNRLVQQAGVHSVHYVPGNHDYRVFDYLSVERHLIDRLAAGDRLRGRVHFYRSFSRPFLRGLLESPEVDFSVVYPHLSLRLGAERLILTHGHLLDASQGFGVDSARAFRRVDPGDGRAVARARQDFFRRVGLYQSLVDGGAVSHQFRKRVYLRALKAWNAFATLSDPTRSGARGRPIDRRLQANIAAYLRFCCRPGRVDGFIFGHTHRPGGIALSRPGGAAIPVWNSGTFLDERRKPAGGPWGSFLLVGAGSGPVAERVRLEWLK
jgi:UDP-2,3-diacylglucosamine pyrophosphatase LpxH